ncbi:hypothetical protein [Halalkalicoccus ordinarius]
MNPLAFAFALPLSQYGTYPIGVLGTITLVASIAITLAWLFHLYR